MAEPVDSWDEPCYNEDSILTQKAVSLPELPCVPIQRTLVAISCLESLQNTLGRHVKARDQKKQVETMISMIAEHNHRVNFGGKYLPIMNIVENRKAFKVKIIGFNGTVHLANAMLDTGCVTEGVIGGNMAKNAGINQNKNGVSFIYIIEVNGKEFIGYCLSNISKTGVTSYIKNRRCACYYDREQVKEWNNGEGGYVSKVQGENIDLLIGYRTLSEMATRGLHITVDPTVAITSVFRHIPFRTGLRTIIGDLELYTHIDSGNFLPFDLNLSRKFVSNNLRLFSNIHPEHYGNTSGTISHMVLGYGDCNIEFYDVTFISFDNSTDMDGNIIDCIPGTQFMKKLLQRRIIVQVI